MLMMRTPLEADTFPGKLKGKTSKNWSLCESAWCWALKFFLFRFFGKFENVLSDVMNREFVLFTLFGLEQAKFNDLARYF